jgi:hypothetical protein
LGRATWALETLLEMKLCISFSFYYKGRGVILQGGDVPKFANVLSAGVRTERRRFNETFYVIIL